jgi:IS30 family transposase
MGRLSESELNELWDLWEAGESQRSIARVLGRSPATIRTRLLSSGWRRPVPPGEWCSLRLSLGEREEISRGIARGESLRSIRVVLAGRLRRCLGRWRSMVAVTSIGRSQHIGRHGEGRNARR